MPNATTKIREYLKFKINPELSLWQELERLIKQLGVENGERAQYIFNQINKLKTQKEKGDYYQNLMDKKIVSEKVDEQIGNLLEQNL